VKTLKKLGWLALAILGIFILALIVFTRTLKPDYNGEKKLPKLTNSVDVYYDPYGIPHIYAQTEEDAFRSLGYVHAQDRLWQMEVLRRVASGGLSEMFGKDLLDTDRFFLSLGIDEASKETVAHMDRNSQMAILSLAYLDGINEFVKNGPTPIEFYLTGIEKEPFNLKDIYNAIGYMAFSFAMAHKTDPLLTGIRNRLGPEYLADLEINSDTSTTWIRTYNRDHIEIPAESITTMVTRALDKLPLPQFEGSNSWVLAPGKTKHGKVILANDPHIGFDQPSVWYEAHISTPDYEKYGYHLAGVPFPLLGHDRELAYGITMFENDDIDFYYEETHPSDPGKYKTTDGWMDFETVSGSIKVKDAKDVTFNYKKTIHGPILNGTLDQITGDQPVSMSWTYTRLENRDLDALYGISQAKNISQFRSALPDIHSPGLNIMYGDAQGNVAWWASAKL
jgi:penicillin amidase